MAESLLQSAPAAPVLSPCTSGPRKQSSSCTDSISMSSPPEFEFWMVRNPPILPQTKLLSADELFSDGALLPLYRLHGSPVRDPTDPNQEKSCHRETTTTGSGSDHGEDSSGLTMVGKNAASKSWKDIFKKIDKGNKKEMKNHDTAGASNNSSSHRIRSAPELININIWPFSRSRSAGNGGIRPYCRMVTGGAGTTRKVSSAPCSRSNSTGGDFKSWKWGASPTQSTGVQVSKNTPILWQVWRGGGAGGSGRTATDLMGGNARNGVQTKNNDFAGVNGESG